MDESTLDRSIDAMDGLFQILENARRSETIEDECRHGIETGLTTALSMVTRIASASADLGWTGDEPYLLLDHGWDGYEILLVAYGRLSETTRQRYGMELARIAEALLKLSRLGRGQARTKMHDLLRDFTVKHPNIDKFRDVLEDVTMGNAEWCELQAAAPELLESLANWQEFEAHLPPRYKAEHLADLVRERKIRTGTTQPRTS